MTREQFLSGTPFYIRQKNYKGDSTYYYDGGHISRQVRSAVDERVVLNDYECNIDKIGKVGFTGYTFVLGKRVVVKLRFEDLIQFEQEA